MGFRLLLSLKVFPWYSCLFFTFCLFFDVTPLIRDTSCSLMPFGYTTCLCKGPISQYALPVVVHRSSRNAIRECLMTPILGGQGRVLLQTIHFLVTSGFHLPISCSSSTGSLHWYSTKELREPFRVVILHWSMETLSSRLAWMMDHLKLSSIPSYFIMKYWKKVLSCLVRMWICNLFLLSVDCRQQQCCLEMLGWPPPLARRSGARSIRSLRSRGRTGKQLWLSRQQLEEEEAG